MSADTVRMVQLARSVSASALWGYSIIKKIARVVPVQSLLFVVFFIASQISLLAAFFLPIKVLVLLGSEDVPSYFPEFLSGFARDALVLMMAVMSVVCFLSHIALEYIDSLLARSGGNLLLLRSGKQLMVGAHDRVVVDGYRDFLKAFAFFIFSSITLLILLVIYIEMFVVVSVLVVVSLAAVLCVCSISSPVMKKVIEELALYLAVISGIIFLSAFLFSIVDFLYFQPPSVIVALVSILLVRQGVQRGFGGIVEYRRLFSRRAEIEPLFFSGKRFSANAARTDDRMLRMLTEGALLKAAGRAVSLLCDGTVEHSDVYRLGRSDIVGVRVSMFDGRMYLVKAFSNEAAVLARHEELLLSSVVYPAFPAPAWVGALEVDSVRCHVFNWGDYERVHRREIGNAVASVFVSLGAVDPPKKLAQAYMQAHLLLGERLKEDWFVGFAGAASEPEMEDLAYLASKVETIRRIVSCSPLSIVSQDLTDDTIVSSEKGSYLAVSWGRWALDSLGVGWPIHDKTHFVQASTIVSRSGAVSTEHLYFVACLAYYERLMSRGELFGAFSLASRMRESLEVLMPDYAAGR